MTKTNFDESGNLQRLYVNFLCCINLKTCSSSKFQIACRGNKKSYLEEAAYESQEISSVSLWLYIRKGAMAFLPRLHLIFDIYLTMTFLPPMI